MPSPPPDRGRQRAEVMYRSTSLVVGEVHCPLFHRGCGPQEHSEQPTIVLVRTGLFTITSRGETVVADPNHVVFFSRHRPYQVAHPVAGGDTCTFFSLGASAEDTPFPVLSGLSTPRTFLLHHLLLAGLRRGEIAALAVEDLVFDLIDDLFAGASALAPGRASDGRRESRRRHRGLVESAKLLIDEDVQNPPALGEVAGALGCSPFHLSRIFRRESGLPMRRYLDRSRLRLALERLADGEQDLTGLALDLGYADHSHFSNAFHREFGLSPSRFRRRAGGALLRAARKNLQA